MKTDFKINRKLITIIKCLCFICLLLLLLSRYTKIMMNKQEMFCSSTLKQYDKNSIEVLFLGSSQMIYAAQPIILWEQYGITSYNMATSATTIPGNYWSAKIAFETQTPKIVMLDCTFAYMETKTFNELPRIHSAIDGFWPSPATYEAINDLVDEPSERFEFYWSPYIYHTRWKELCEEDFVEISDHGAGGAYLRNNITNLDGIMRQYPKEEMWDVPQINLNYIEKLMKLCEKNNSKLLLTVLPIPICVDYQPVYNTLQSWAEERGIPFLNGYDDSAFWGLDYGTDFVDEAHMNIHGVQKSSAYIGNYLMEHLDIDSSSYDEQTYSFWDERMQEYNAFRDAIWTYPTLSYDTAITFGTGGNQDQFYGGVGNIPRLIDPSGIFTWTTGPRSDFYFTIDESVDALLWFDLAAVQPIIGKNTRTVEVYVNEQYVSTLEIEAAMEPTAFSVEIDADLWTNQKEQKLTLKYPEYESAAFGAIPLNYTLGLKEITLERN